MKALSISLLVLGLLQGCGTKGPLYLPPAPPSPASPPTTAPADSGQPHK